MYDTAGIKKHFCIFALVCMMQYVLIQREKENKERANEGGERESNMSLSLCCPPPPFLALAPSLSLFHPRSPSFTLSHTR